MNACVCIKMITSHINLIFANDIIIHISEESAILIKAVLLTGDFTLNLIS